jgi:hypothetical protein
MDHPYTTRAISQEERRLAQASIAPEAVSTTSDLYAAALLQAALAVGVIGAIAYLLSSNLPEVRANLWLGLIFIFLAAFVIAYRRSSARDLELRKQQQKLEQELASGTVETATFRAVEAMLIQRDPPTICYLLDDGRGLLLRSYPGGRHPDSEFEIVRLPISRAILRCPTFGRELPVATELPEETDPQVRAEGEPFPIDWPALARGNLVIR